MNRKVFLRILLICLGIGLITIAIFAFQLGLDNNPDWGMRRSQLVGLGTTIIVFAVSYWVTPWLSHWVVEQKYKPLDAMKRFLQSVSLHPVVHQTRLRYKVSPGFFILATISILIYFWILTAGRFTQWPTGKNYYNLLAQAFEHGQLNLLLKPPSELLELNNPYDYRTRENISYLWDASLYKGKYYLYWGPVPGVIGALLLALTARPISDAGFVLGFIVLGVFGGVLLAWKFCRDFNFPPWLFWGSAIALALNSPLLWLLTRPSVYEASIAGGQAFSLAGLYFGYLAFRSRIVSKRYLGLFGLMLGLAAGTRTSLMVSSAALALLTAIYLFIRYGNQPRKFFLAAFSFGWPLVAIFSGLLWYNYARFGSIFETGHCYQLTGLALPPNYEDVTSFKYLLPNLYTCVFRFPTLSEKFPFVSIPWIKESMWPSFIHLPENYYYSEPTVGILFTVPIIGLTTGLLIWLIWRWLNGESGSVILRTKLQRSFLLWWSAALFIQAFLPLAVLLVFISSSFRYLADISASSILFSTLFVGLHLKNFRLSRFLPLAWCFVAILTGAVGLLIGHSKHFADLNPGLYEWLSQWLRFQ
jgi:hypothetical protein